ncbi:hypothetical protein HN51_048472 [Arachis hypogaea]
MLSARESLSLLHSWHHSPPEGPTQSHLRSFKPDVTTPESTSLLPARKQLPPTEIPFDKRRVAFITMSRTSMSCPHVAGIAGLLKTLRPEWRPSAIKSAIMTSARTRNKGDEPMFDGDFKTVTPYAYGFSHVRPNRAMDPGLVYDTTIDDYLNFLCAIG